MNDHIVDYVDSGHPEGMVAVLPPHRPLDWTDDGLTCAPGIPCSAIADTSNERCAKREAVVFLPLVRAKYTRVGSGAIDVFLCGAHFIVHRAGKPIRVLVVTGRMR